MGNPLLSAASLKPGGMSVIGAALCALIAAAGVAWASQADPKTPEEVYRPMSVEQAAKLALMVKKDRYVALVSFRSAYEMPPDGSDPPMPSTYRKQTPKNVALHIDGFFGLLEEIHLAPPPLGRFSGDVVVEMQWGGDEAFHRVQALDSDWSMAAPSAAWWARSRIPRTLLAVQCKKGGGILDAWFFGPLAPGEDKGLREFVDYLLAHPFEKIPKADAEALASRPNVWMCLLGLARLESLQVHAPKVFFEAMRRVPAESVPGLLTDLVDYAALFKEAEKQELLRELAAFVDSAEPSRQLALLDRLIWHQQLHQLDNSLVLTDDLVKSLRKQAEARSGQKDWADVVTRYRDLLGLLVKERPDKGAAQ
jgi:hypothetical protein